MNLNHIFLPRSRVVTRLKVINKRVDGSVIGDLAALVIPAESGIYKIMEGLIGE